MISCSRKQILCCLYCLVTKIRYYDHWASQFSAWTQKGPINFWQLSNIVSTLTWSQGSPNIRTYCTYWFSITPTEGQLFWPLYCIWRVSSLFFGAFIWWRMQTSGVFASLLLMLCHLWAYAIRPLSPPVLLSPVNWSATQWVTSDWLMLN